jgi:DNA-directed RNA polymerase subunit RPC12/RpoP
MLRSRTLRCSVERLWKMKAGEPAHCPNCQSDMILVRTQRDQPGFELQTLHCPRCDSTHRWMVRKQAPSPIGSQPVSKRAMPKLLARLWKRK